MAGRTQEVVNSRSNRSDLMANQNRYLGVRYHLVRYATEENGGDSTSTVRSHDNQIAALVLCGLDDRAIGLIVLNLDRIARNTSGLGCARDVI